MPSWSQRARARIGGLRPAQRELSHKAGAHKRERWSGGCMTSTPDNTPDTADQPDELETADLPEIDHGTDDDDAPVDNPSGG